MQVVEEALGDSSARTEFELYVPGLLILAVSMLVYQASIVVVREVEAGTLDRLRITRLSAFALLGGISVSQVIVGATAVVLTFGTALALGFHSTGPVWVAVLFGAGDALEIGAAGGRRARGVMVEAGTSFSMTRDVLILAGWR